MPALAATDTLPGHQDITLQDLETASSAWLDSLGFGVIGLTKDGIATTYNATEQRLAGLSAARVIGGDFFNEIGICMNNFLVAQRFIDEAVLDETVDYVLTLRMRPTPVKLRLLQHPDVVHRYLLVQR